MSNHLILLVGAGPMASAHAAVIRALGREALGVSRRPESAERFSAETGFPAVAGGVEGFFANPDRPAVDAAVVAVGLTELADVTRTLILSGVKRILVEKPAGLTLPEIESLDQEARARGASVYLAYNRRFYAATAIARDMIAEDGGVSSFFFDFAEVASRTVVPGRDVRILNNWYLANSSHVVDLAFHLCGRPVTVNAQVKGSLDWHPAGASFVGSGAAEGGAIFSYIADWAAPGRWGVDIRTPKRRLIMQPMETLKVQALGSFAVQDVELDDLDTRFKPGLFRQMEAFLGGSPETTPLQSLSAHVRAVREDFLPLIGVKA